MDRWYDDEIKSFDDDLLGRAGYARRLAKLIDEIHSWDSSVVFGLTGPWGSGKSSMIRLTCAALAETSGKWAIAKFTPWATNSDQDMLAEFYSAISAALPRKKSKKARKALANCIKVLAPAAHLLPVAGGTVAEYAAGAGELLEPPPSWDEVFQKCATEIRDLNIPVLVIADDIDRLQRRELLSLLKVVRLLGRFGGVNYLLAYDEATLHAQIESSSEGPGARNGRLFMEKIVQYPMLVPPLLPAQMRAHLSAGLLNIASRTGWRIDADDFRLSEVDDAFTRQLTTLRSVDRFLAQVEVLAALHGKDEIAIVDLALMTFIRMQFPDLYSRLPALRDVLTKRTQRGTAQNQEDTPDWDMILVGLTRENRSDAQQVLEVLFPNLNGSILSTAPAKGVSDRRYFERYLVHAIPDNDIADRVVLDALSEALTAGPAGTQLRDLLAGDSNWRVSLALDKLRALSTLPDRGTPGSEMVSVPLLCAVMELLPQLERPGMSVYPTQRVGYTWAGEIYALLVDRADPEELLAALHTAGDLTLTLQAWASSPRRAAAVGGSVSPTEILVRNDLARRLIKQVLDHLRQRDDADITTPIPFLVDGVRIAGGLPAMQAAVNEAITLGEFTVDDLAARFVTVSHPIGAEDLKEIADFDRRGFLLVAPAAVAFQNDPGTPGPDDDISWTNRRAVAYAQRDADGLAFEFSAPPERSACSSEDESTD